MPQGQLAHDAILLLSLQRNVINECLSSEYPTYRNENEVLPYLILAALIPHTKRQNELFLRFCKLFFLSSPCLPWQPGRRQQGWYISGALRKQFPNLTVQFILSLSSFLGKRHILLLRL